MANEKLKAFMANKEEILKKLRDKKWKVVSDAFEIGCITLEKELIEFLNKQTKTSWHRLKFKTPYKWADSGGYPLYNKSYERVVITGISNLPKEILEDVGIENAIGNGNLILLEAHTQFEYYRPGNLIKNPASHFTGYHGGKHNLPKFKDKYEFLQLKGFRDSVYYKHFPKLHQKLKVMVMKSYINYLNEKVEDKEQRSKKWNKNLKEKEDELNQEKEKLKQFKSQARKMKQNTKTANERMTKVVENYEVELEM